MATWEVLPPPAAGRVCGDDDGVAVVGVSWRSILTRAVALCVILSAAFWSRDGPGVGCAWLSTTVEISYWAGYGAVVLKGSTMHLNHCKLLHHAKH